MVAKAKPARRRRAPSTEGESEPMSAAIQQSDQSRTDIERPIAPPGMTYNRKGALVKQRKQSARSNKVFVVMQILDTDGTPHQEIGKRNIKVIKTERNSDKVLEMIDSGEYDGAFYLRLDLAAK
jgi:hypothetical protein